jgi:hypothetical protein
MAHMELAQAEDPLNMAEGGTFEEAGAPFLVSGRGQWLRRAGKAAFGLTVLGLIAWSAHEMSRSALAPAPPNRFTELLNANAVEKMGRPLTVMEHNVLARHFPKAARRFLDDMPAPSAACQEDFGKNMQKAMAKAVSLMQQMSENKCMMAQSEADLSDTCKDLVAKINNMEEVMKQECKDEPTTDICTLAHEGFDDEDACLPKSCQNKEDYEVLAGDRHAAGTITCAS